MIRVMLAGDELAGLAVTEPAASVRLLLPPPGSTDLVMPQWNGNEFLMADGSRPIIRTFTPRRLTPAGLDLDLVIHPGGAASTWAEGAQPGDPAAISGPGRGYAIAGAAPGYFLAGDETAIPAIAQLLEHIPKTISTSVHLEVHADFGRIELPDHPAATVIWHEAAREAEAGTELLAAIRAADLDDETLIWCAGEAAAMHAIRTYLFKDLRVARARATVRGYWKKRDA